MLHISLYNLSLDTHQNKDQSTYNVCLLQKRKVKYWVKNVKDGDVHVLLMRDEKEGRKKQARSNKQQGKATQHTQGSHFS